MEKLYGLHFYINISNFDDVIESEESRTGTLNHSIHALDTFFSSIEVFGKSHYPNSFVVEKITGSRLHLYVIDDINTAFNVVSSVSQFALKLSYHINKSIPKYATLIDFKIQIGACYGQFYNFTFTRADADEDTSIGYAANYAAKLQAMTADGHISISSNIFDKLSKDMQNKFERVKDERIKKYDQDYYYRTKINNLTTIYAFDDDLSAVQELAKKVNLTDMAFRVADKPIQYRNLSKKECKKVYGIPLFADVRDFTSQFDKDDVNLEEMAKKTQEILTSMYCSVENYNGIHVQFQGDREEALFHDYTGYKCSEDAVLAGLKIIDAVKPFYVSVGVGQAVGKLFAARIGARSEKDNLLLGRTVLEADSNEDEKAHANQLVISSKIYDSIKNSNVKLAKIFKQYDEVSYVTTYGYNEFKKTLIYSQLDYNNKSNNYNGAWGE